MINSAAGIKHYGKIIKKIDKNDKTVVFHVCGVDEDWEHVIL